MLIGFFFEQGILSEGVGRRMIDYYRRLLTEAVRVVDGFPEKLRAAGENNKDEEVDVDELFELHYREMERADGEAVKAWAKFDKTWCPGIAMFSLAEAAREAGRQLRPLAARIADFSAGGHWFNQMLAVLDDEPFIAIELDRGIGVRGRMSGVSDNFQLHILLMDVFRGGWLNAGKVDPEIIENAKGYGEQVLNRTVSGKWNMCGWTIVTPGFQPGDCSDFQKSEHWIWGEGLPEDIPLFEGCRVILLGKPLYERIIAAQRTFKHLRAELTVEHRYSRSEIQELLAKMGAAPKPLAIGGQD
ncbi:MAG: hypothetical protein JSS81_30165 [Acidobacteria bacterium]|nr:hypothetical protein [Acidobacteriota bacterium]